MTGLRAVTALRGPLERAQERVSLGEALLGRLPDVSARIPWELLAAGDNESTQDAYDAADPVWLERWASVAAAARLIAERVAAGATGSPTDGEPLAGLVRQSATGRLRLAMLLRLTWWLRDAACSVLREEASRLAVSPAALAQARARVTESCEQLLVDLADRLDSELASADGRLAYLAAHDELTGLATRAVCLSALDAALAGAMTDAGVAVLCLDVDAFAALNDAFGPQAGDDLLVETARRLRGSLRERDLVGRSGSDEFLVICHGLRTSAAVRRAGARLQEILATPFVAAGRQVSLTVSVGAALARRGEPGRQLVGRAEAALRTAQQLGQGRLQMAGARGAGADLQLIADLRQALAREELSVLYQPVVDLATESINSVEALARWRPTGGEPVPPAEFIPLAEASGSILAIGEWVLITACRDAQHLASVADRPVRVAVNVSVRQLSEARFPDMVRAALRASGLPAQHLTLELTESLFADAGAERVLGRLKSLGVQLAIDDFGTGYSSLSYLRRFSIDWVKLDRSLLPSGPDLSGQVLFAGTVYLAHELGMKVVAEGVETESQLDAVRRAGCDAVQGYVFGRPQALAEFTATRLAPPAPTQPGA